MKDLPNRFTKQLLGHGVLYAFLEQAEGTIFGENNGTPYSSTPTTPFQIEGVPSCIY